MVCIVCICRILAGEHPYPTEGEQDWYHYRSIQSKDEEDFKKKVGALLKGVVQKGGFSTSFVVWPMTMYVNSDWNAIAAYKLSPEKSKVRFLGL